MKSPWAHLRNAKHIDWVLATNDTYPSSWRTDQNAAWHDARGAAASACLALIAWDDSADLIALSADAVRLLATCGDHRAILLTPACRVRAELLTLKESTS